MEILSLLEKRPEIIALNQGKTSHLETPPGDILEDIRPFQPALPPLVILTWRKQWRLFILPPENVR
jgi:hypothetical protein